ncbi:hypothetical protein AB0L75_28120 [Streptomyces sp. NPDC052101]|uniref:hypothetical protein n=1 Tax=Streptomyces sp. NPDC052101 TaxID=3155763 RepID=UPI0034483923
MDASSDQSGIPRRRFLKGTLAITAGGVLVPAVAGSSRAADRLPALGQTVSLSVIVFGAVMTSNLQPGEQRLNFIGSRQVKVLAGGTDFVRLQTLDFRIEAAHPLFGKITMSLPDIDVTSASTVRLAPNGVTETWIESPAITFEKSGDTEGPYIYYTEKPLTATAAMPSWPPPPQDTNSDGSPTGGTLYSPVQLPTFTAGDVSERVDFTAFPPSLGRL